MRPETWLIACHDAGGAEVVAAWVKANPGNQYIYNLGGPALDIFKRKLGEHRLEYFSTNKSYALDFVLTGTSWGSEIELEALKFAKSQGVRSAVFLDHWSTYNERFGSPGKEVYPDEIWVGDQYALRIARNLFTNLQVSLQKNFYLEEVVLNIRKLERSLPNSIPGIKVLYVTEPITDALKKKYNDPNYYGYSEFDALAGFLDFLKMTTEKFSEVRIRLHPSESDNKYDLLLADYSLRVPVHIARDTTLEEECAWADWVVGCQSMAMVVALHAGKKVFSSIPKGGRPSLLPHEEIISIFP